MNEQNRQESGKLDQGAGLGVGCFIGRSERN